MNKFSFKKRELSLRRIHIWLVGTMIVIAILVIFATFRMTNTFMRLAEASEDHTELEKAAHELMDASDYLTERVQRFTLNGNRTYMDQYFTEAFESNRREEAIERMRMEGATSALENLKNAMAHSVKLMDQEYYAMRLVVEAKGISVHPEVLDEVELSVEDSELTPDEKIRRATELVLNDDYYEQKDKIRKEMQESIREVDRLMEEVRNREITRLRRDMGFVHVVLLVQVLSLIFMLRLTSLLGINPILRAVDRIKEEEPIQEVGAIEFKYLAQAYNKMYSKHASSVEHLSFKAYHDELTGVYNRAGYDHLLASLDIGSTYMMLLDVDNFKGINDTYGHETGDKVLIKLARVLNTIFRDDDCICRIGGDEFVIFMVHSSGMKKRLIESKIEQINTELQSTDDGLPPVSISVGIVNGKDVADAENLFEKTDAAMYESKKRGKQTYTFYNDTE
ncbi:MAG: diguanylate cyclase [Lachnospiraceae bacterium]|nr:diguanylate cyclase [Lachnospiraceae bacterium]